MQTSTNKFGERPSLIQLNFRANSRDGDLISDQRSDGPLLISRIGTMNNNYGNSSITILSNTIEFMLLSCEKSYYDHHRSVQNFDNNNPFAEPSLISSNINGGLGCFAAYNRSSIVLKK